MTFVLMSFDESSFAVHLTHSPYLHGLRKK
jgi:hypothetical protein